MVQVVDSKHRLCLYIFDFYIKIKKPTNARLPNQEPDLIFKLRLIFYKLHFALDEIFLF